MTYVEAIQKIEDALTALNVRDKYGEPYEGIELVGLIHQNYPTAWTENEDALEFGRITVDQYAEAALSLIENTGRIRYRAKLERKLSSLMGVAS